MVKEKEKANSTRNKKVFLDWTTDLLIYITILNLFAQYSSSIYFETFTISILTAIVLKALLVLIVDLEHSVLKYFKKKQGEIYKYIGGISMFLILFLSKFVILEIIDILFRERVEIKGFIPLVAMIITMIATRKILEKIYKEL